MSRKNISSGSKMENIAKYSRAVVDGKWIFISGTVGSDPSTGKIPEDVGEQTRMSFRIIETVLEQAEFSLSDVVRTRVFITSQEYVNAVVEVLAEVFAEICPANTTVICQLPVAKAKVEIEVTARRHKKK